MTGTIGAGDRCSPLFPRDFGFYRCKEVAQCFPHYCFRLSRVSVSKSLMVVAVFDRKVVSSWVATGRWICGQAGSSGLLLACVSSQFVLHCLALHGHVGQIARVSSSTQKSGDLSTSEVLVSRGNWGLRRRHNRESEDQSLNPQNPRKFRCRHACP